MPVFVDELFTMESRDPQAFRVGQRNGHRWCHLTCDDLAELHAVAAKIGMKRAWFQHDNALPHYDLTPRMRARAITAGAVEITRTELVNLMHRWRKGGDLHDRFPKPPSRASHNPPATPLF